jgi:hypothetical protein
MAFMIYFTESQMFVVVDVEGCASFVEMIVKDDGSLYGQNR